MEALADFILEFPLQYERREEDDKALMMKGQTLKFPFRIKINKAN